MMFAAHNRPPLKESLQTLIAQSQSSINEEDENCMTILEHMLMIEKDHKMANKLVRRGASVNHIDRNGNPILIKLVQNKKHEAIKFLVSKGALLHIVDESGMDACDYAKHNNLAKLKGFSFFNDCSKAHKKRDA